MKQFRIKHCPTGYYLKNKTLSKTGKIYKSEKDNILNLGEDTVTISTTNKQFVDNTLNVINWRIYTDSLGNVYFADIPKSEFIIEYLSDEQEKPYRVKHKLSGLYYDSGYKLTEKGKTYLTNKNILSATKEDHIFICTLEGSKFYQQTKNIINWKKSNSPNVHDDRFVFANILKSEFELEPINLNS